MNYYMLGFIFGIVFAIGIALIAWNIRRKLHPNSGKYDERQMIGRGKAFQAGFFTTLIASAGVSIWEYIAEGLPGAPFLWHIGALLLGVMVFALTAIHFDAYVGVYDTPARFIRIGVCFMVALGLIGFVNLRTDRPEGQVTAILDLAIAAMWVVIVIALMLHQKGASKEDEE